MFMRCPSVSCRQVTLSWHLFHMWSAHPLLTLRINDHPKPTPVSGFFLAALNKLLVAKTATSDQAHVSRISRYLSIRIKGLTFISKAVCSKTHALLSASTFPPPLCSTINRSIHSLVSLIALSIKLMFHLFPHITNLSVLALWIKQAVSCMNSILQTGLSCLVTWVDALGDLEVKDTMVEADWFLICHDIWDHIPQDSRRMKALCQQEVYNEYFICSYTEHVSPVLKKSIFRYIRY